MKKEMVISVLVGLIFGLIITYGVYTAQVSLRKKTNPEDLVVTPTPNAQVESGEITLLSPPDESIQDTADVTVTGTTTPHSFVVVFINNDENITTADETGNFSISSELESGSNIITVYSLNEDGGSTSVERTVILSTEPLTDEEKQTHNNQTTNN